VLGFVEAMELVFLRVQRRINSKIFKSIMGIEARVRMTVLRAGPGLYLQAVRLLLSSILWLLPRGAPR